MLRPGGQTASARSPESSQEDLQGVFLYQGFTYWGDVDGHWGGGKEPCAQQQGTSWCSGAVTTKVSSVPADFSDLFGAPKDEKPKTKKEPKKLSAEEQEKKDFEKEMQMNLVSKSLFISIDRMFLTTSWLQLVLCPSVSMSFLGCLSVPHHLLETSFH